MEFRKIATYTIVDREVFIREIEQIGHMMYALDIKENDNMLSCVAVPVFDSTGRPFAGLSLTGLYRQEEDLSLIAKDLIEASKLISTSLGYLGSYKND